MSWWQRGVIYHVYPRSFADADGDGVGDLRGIAARLDHLRLARRRRAVAVADLPLADEGLRLRHLRPLRDRAGCSARSRTSTRWSPPRTSAALRLLLDFVPNHTSDEHPWFREHPPRLVPLERRAAQQLDRVFGGPAWTLDQERGQFYYHAYLREQPDLNWRNPELREAMLGVLRFWLDRGVDGFRVDALRQVLKDPELRDNPPNPDYRPGQPEYDSLLPIRSADHDDLDPVRAIARGDRRARTA